MNMLKRVAFTLLYSLMIFFLSLTVAYGACVAEPDSIVVFSGSTNLGEVAPNSKTYIKSDLNSDPLKVEFTFSNIDENCFTSANDMRFKLFPEGSESTATSFQNSNSGGEHISKFTFTFKINYNLTNDFSSTYLVQTTDGLQNVGALYWGADTMPPVFSYIETNADTGLMKGGEEFILNYAVSDQHSGLQSLVITGGTSSIINFNGNKTYQGQFKDSPTSSRTYTLRATDMLGKESTKTIRVEVDSNAPLVQSFTPLYSFNAQQMVGYTAIVQDPSFEFSTQEPEVTADFSQINPYFANYDASCSRKDNTSFECYWNPFIITLGQSSNVNIKINVTDPVGNTAIRTFPENVFFDSNKPQVLEFKLLNRNNVSNIFSPEDDNVRVMLKFRDESISKATTMPRIIERFGQIPFVEKSCTFISDIGSCTWDLGNSVSVYSGKNLNSTLFRLNIIDAFTNSHIEELSVKVDSKEPIYQGMEILETESIKDNVLKSGERFNVRIFVEDDNLFSNGYFIRGDFSNIDFRDGMEDKEAACSIFNSSTTRCDFNGIVAENGYMLRNVTFYISDSAGNEIVVKEPIEIFKISDEVVSSYKIPSIPTTNPINRNLILESSVVSWFEGEIELKGSPSMKIVNYQLLSCNESDLNPLLIVEYSLFPDDVVINNGEEDISEFAMRVQLKDHSNVNDLNSKTMTCTMSILKRDDTTVYAPEYVEFDLKFSFYDMPRGNLIKAHAQKILDMTEEVDYLGGWFDSIYDIYSVFNSICEIVGNGKGTLSTVNGVWTNFRILTHSYTELTGAEAGMIRIDEAIENSDGTISETFSDILGPVKRICDYVTCRNGGLLGDFWGGMLDETGISETYTNVCSGDFIFGEG